MNIWIVVPTYNERANLEPLLDGIFKNPDVSVLIVDDNSPDGTGQQAELLRAHWPRLAVLHRPNKAGLGPAYHHGLQVALDRGADIVIHHDADLSHPPELIPRLVTALDQADLAIASRYIPGGAVRIALHRRWISTIGNWYLRSMLGFAVHDWSSGFKAWRAPLLQQVLQQPLQTTGYACLMEMTWYARQLGARVTEVPLEFIDRRQGASKFNARIIIEDIRMAWQLRCTTRLAKQSKN